LRIQLRRFPLSEMSDQKTFYSVSTLARRVGRSRRTVQAQLQLKTIAPDSELLLPSGRRVALFEEKTLALLLHQQPKEKL